MYAIRSYYGLAEPAVCPVNRLFDGRDGLLRREEIGQTEEARLEHGVDPTSESSYNFV